MRACTTSIDTQLIRCCLVQVMSRSVSSRCTTVRSMRHCIALESGRFAKDAYRRTCLVDRSRRRACGLFEKTNSIVDAFKDSKTRRIERGMIALAVLEDAIGPERDACATWSLIIALRLIPPCQYIVDTAMTTDEPCVSDRVRMRLRRAFSHTSSQLAWPAAACERLE